MNIRQCRGTRCDPQIQHPLHRARFASPFSCRGDARARVRPMRPWHSQGTPELCPPTCVVETTSPLPLPPMTVTAPMLRCRATPHGCWPSCFRLRMCANEARRPLLRKGSAETGFLQCCDASSRPGSCRGTGWPGCRHLSSAPAAGAAMRSRREKVFGPGRAVPLDRNAKARVMAYARAWSVLKACAAGANRGPTHRRYGPRGVRQP